MSLLDRRRILPATALVAALALAGCGTIPQAGGADRARFRPRVLLAAVPRSPRTLRRPSGDPSSTPTPDPVTFTPNVEDGAKNVKVDTVVAVKAANGTVGAVKLTYAGKDSKGKSVKGTVERRRWPRTRPAGRPAERLEPTATYKLTDAGTNPRARRVKHQDHVFTTQALTLQQQTFPQL